jgi:hypothetical protein
LMTTTPAPGNDAMTRYVFGFVDCFLFSCVMSECLIAFPLVVAFCFESDDVFFLVLPTLFESDDNLFRCRTQFLLRSMILRDRKSLTRTHACILGFFTRVSCSICALQMRSLNWLTLALVKPPPFCTRQTGMKFAAVTAMTGASSWNDPRSFLEGI